MARLLAINPSSSEATYGLGQAVRRTDPQESERLLQRFRTLKQRENQLEDVKSLGNRAYVAINKGQWSDAVSSLQEAIRQCGKCEVLADLHKDLGLALCHSGKLTEGKEELLESLRLNPSDRDTLQRSECDLSSIMRSEEPRRSSSLPFAKAVEF